MKLINSLKKCVFIGLCTLANNRGELNIRSLYMDRDELNKKMTALWDKREKEDWTEKESKEYLELKERAKKNSSLIKERSEFLELFKMDKSKEETKEFQKFSLCNALKGLVTGKLTGREREIDSELRRRGHDFDKKDNILIPSDTFLGPIMQRQVGGQDALVSDPIRPELAQLAIREMSIIERLGITRLQAMGSFNYPKQSNSTTSAFFSGDGGADANDSIGESDPTFISQSSEPHFLGTRTGWTIAQIKKIGNNLSLEMLLRRSMVESMNEALNDKMLNGNATTATAEPNGLLQLLGSDNDNAKDLTGQKKWTWANLSDGKKRV